MKKQETVWLFHPIIPTKTTREWCTYCSVNCIIKMFYLDHRGVGQQQFLTSVDRVGT